MQSKEMPKILCVVVLVCLLSPLPPPPLQFVACKAKLRVPANLKDAGTIQRVETRTVYLKKKKNPSFVVAVFVCFVSLLLLLLLMKILTIFK